MANGLKTIIYPVSDLAGAKARFAALFGVDPYIDQPYYVAFNVDGNDVGLDPQGHGKGMTGALPYWLVDDITVSLEDMVAAGAEIQQDSTDVGGGNLIAIVKDADGNLIGLMQAA